MTDGERLDELVERNRAGRASAQEKIDLLFLVAKLPPATVPRLIVEELATDPDEEVRLYALESLVLDLKFKDTRAAEICWRALLRDADSEVQGMAAACLGSIYFGSRKREIFERLKGRFFQAGTTPSVQWSLFDSMRGLIGLPPERWQLPRASLLSVGPDESRLTELESALIEPG